MKLSNEFLQVINATKGTLLNTQSPDFSWDEFIQLAIRHCLVPQIYNNLKDSSQIPSDILLRLKKYSSQLGFRTLHNTAEVLRITKFFEKKQSELIFIKGLPLTLQLFGDHNLRQSCDIDFLVRESDLPVVINHMTELGYQTVSPQYRLEGKRFKYHLNNFRDISFFHPQYKTSVEVHFKLGYRWVDFLSFDQISKHYVLYKNINIPTLSCEENFVFLMLNGASEGWRFLRGLYDIVKYIERQPSPNWQIVWQLSKQLGVIDILSQTLILVNHVFATKLPDGIISIHPNTRVDKLVRLSLQTVISKTKINGVYDRMFYQHYFNYYLCLESGLKGKIKSVTNVLIDLTKVFNKINLPDSLFFLYYFLYPCILIGKFIPKRYRK